jgi:hypothetical protein
MLQALPSPLTYQGLKVLISGSGNVAQYAALKVLELGGSVLTLSDSRGALVATDGKGFTVDDIATIANIKLSRGYLTDFVGTPGVAERFQYHEGQRPWTLVDRADIALPSATQNEVSGDEAKALIAAGVRIVAEGSNMVNNPFPIFNTSNDLSRYSRDQLKKPSMFSSTTVQPLVPTRSGMLQERRPIAVVLLSPVLKWPKTPNVCNGPRRRLMPS